MIITNAIKSAWQNTSPLQKGALLTCLGAITAIVGLSIGIEKGGAWPLAIGGSFFVWSMPLALLVRCLRKKPEYTELNPPPALD